MDAADAPVEESIFVALQPITTDWCKIDIPHMTLVYAGEIKDHQPSDFNELSKDASMLAALTRPITLKVNGREAMGPPEDRVDALIIQPSTELLAMRRALEGWNESEFPFKPHATIGPVGTPIPSIPSYLAFDRILVGWGEEYLTFWLNRSYGG